MLKTCNKLLMATYRLDHDSYGIVADENRNCSAHFLLAFDIWIIKCNILMFKKVAYERSWWHINKRDYITGFGNSTCSVYDKPTVRFVNEAWRLLTPMVSNLSSQHFGCQSDVDDFGPILENVVRMSSITYLAKAFANQNSGHYLQHEHQFDDIIT